jgi:hypothetical protein
MNFKWYKLIPFLHNTSELVRVVHVSSCSRLKSSKCADLGVGMLKVNVNELHSLLGRGIGAVIEALEAPDRVSGILLGPNH